MSTSSLTYSEKDKPKCVVPNREEEYISRPMRRDERFLHSIPHQRSVFDTPTTKTATNAIQSISTSSNSDHSILRHSRKTSMSSIPESDQEDAEIPLLKQTTQQQQQQQQHYRQDSWNSANWNFIQPVHQPFHTRDRTVSWSSIVTVDSNDASRPDPPNHVPVRLPVRKFFTMPPQSKPLVKLQAQPPVHCSQNLHFFLMLVLIDLITVGRLHLIVQTLKTMLVLLKMLILLI